MMEDGSEQTSIRPIRPTQVDMKHVDDQTPGAFDDVHVRQIKDDQVPPSEGQQAVPSQTSSEEEQSKTDTQETIGQEVVPTLDQEAKVNHAEAVMTSEVKPLTDEERFTESRDGIQSRTYRMIVDVVKMSADERSAFVDKQRDRFLHAVEAFSEDKSYSERGGTYLQKLGIEAVTLIENDLIPGVNKESKALLSDLFVRTPIPKSLVMPLSHVLGEIVSGKVEKKLQNGADYVKAQLQKIESQNDAPDVKSWLDRVKLAHQNLRERKIVGPEEIPIPQVEAPVPVKILDLGRFVSHADVVDDPVRDVDPYYKEKMDVTDQYAEKVDEVRKRVYTEFTQTELDAFTSEQAKQLAERIYTEASNEFQEEQLYGRPLKSKIVEGKLQYYVEYDIRDKDDCIRFGEGSASQVVQLNRSGTLDMRTVDELRSRDERNKLDKLNPSFSEVYKRRQLNLSQI